LATRPLVHRPRENLPAMPKEKEHGKVFLFGFGLQNLHDRANAEPQEIEARMSLESLGIALMVVAVWWIILRNI
jgi:hypothetical protein